MYAAPKPIAPKIPPKIPPENPVPGRHRRVYGWLYWTAYTLFVIIAALILAAAIIIVCVGV